MVSDLAVQVFDKNLDRVGWLGSYEAATFTMRHNALSTGSLVVPADHHMVPDLNEPGARVLVTYRGEHLMSGPIRLVEVEGVGPAQGLTYQVADDWRLLRRLLAWQVPGSAVTAQGTATHKVYTGPAETVVKAMLTDNLTRLGAAMRPAVTVAPSLGRGSTITVQARMSLPADVLFPLVDQAGIGVTVRQVGAGLVVDCYVPEVWPITLSVEAGTLTDVSWSRRPPEVTRGVVGIGGEDTARQFYAFADTALEAEWGDVVEVFVDARDIKTDDPAKATLAAARAAEALAEGAAQTGLALSLSETQTFRYGGGGIHVGDVVTAKLATGVEVTDVVREATVSIAPDKGLTVTPVIGERPAGDTAVVRAVGALFKHMRKIQGR